MLIVFEQNFSFAVFFAFAIKHQIICLFNVNEQPNIRLEKKLINIQKQLKTANASLQELLKDDKKIRKNKNIRMSHSNIRSKNQGQSKDKLDKSNCRKIDEKGVKLDPQVDINRKSWVMKLVDKIEFNTESCEQAILEKSETSDNKDTQIRQSLPKISLQTLDIDNNDGIDPYLSSLMSKRSKKPNNNRKHGRRKSQEFISNLEISKTLKGTNSKLKIPREHELKQRYKILKIES